MQAQAVSPTNGYGDLSPGKYALSSVLLIEVVLTAGFLMVIMGATAKRAPAGFAPIAIGLALTLIHLISIPVTNTSVNPARSTGGAFFAETAALSQLWAFWVAPIVGAVIGAVLSALWQKLKTDLQNFKSTASRCWDLSKNTQTNKARSSV